MIGGRPQQPVLRSLCVAVQIMPAHWITFATTPDPSLKVVFVTQSIHELPEPRALIRRKLMFASEAFKRFALPCSEVAINVTNYAGEQHKKPAIHPPAIALRFSMNFVISTCHPMSDNRTALGGCTQVRLALTFLEQLSLTSSRILTLATPSP
jgi:hypothetical protein